MKRFILSAIVTLGIVGSAAAATKLAPSYRAVYCYDGGTYWAKQKAAFPDYYAAHNAFYEANYGAATRYCPAV